MEGSEGVEALTLNPDGSYARNPEIALPKPTFFTSERTESGWTIEAEWHFGYVGDFYTITLYFHPKEGLNVWKNRKVNGEYLMEEGDMGDLCTWLREEGRELA